MNDDTWLMSSSELARWAGLLGADDWSWIVYKSIFIGGGLIGIWLLFTYFLFAGLIRHLSLTLKLKRNILISRFKITPNQTVGSALISVVTFSLTHSAIFSNGVFAYLLNSAIPASELAGISEFTFKYFSIIGWFFI